MKSILAALALIIGSCLMFAVFHMRPYNLHEGELKLQSWDQENLKKNDNGCPTAIFVAPGGELKQCRP